MKEETKATIKKTGKTLTFSSPGLIALFAYPTETLSFLKMMKEAGVDLPTIGTILVIAWWLRKDVHRVVDGKMTDFVQSVDNLGKGLKSVSEEMKTTSEQTAKQLQDGEKKFEIFTKQMEVFALQIRFIVTHLQLPWPPEEQKKDPPQDPDLTQ